jgi:hypothetical protein
MKILSLNQVSCRQTDIVFGSSIVRAAWWFVCVCGMLILAVYLFVYGHIGVFELPRLLTAGLGLFSLLIVLLTAHTLRAARRPSNWVLRVQGDDLLIKFRSYENWKMSDDDPQVVALRQDEIKFARNSVTRQVGQSMDGKGVQATKQVALEIGLKDSDTSELERSLADEAARPGYGSERHRTKWSDNPVEVVEKNVIRIAWKGGAATVRPGIKAALDALGRIVNVDEMRKSVEDLTATALKNLAPEEQKKKLRELAMRDRIQAGKTAQQLYGCSLSEAMKIVQDSIAGTETESK